MSRIDLDKIADGGATDGQSPVWRDADNAYVPEDPPSGSAHVIEDEGTPLTQRANLNFEGAGVTATDDAANDTTIVTISGGGGGGGGVSHSYVGYNTVGASWEAIGVKAYLKKITLAAAGTLINVAGYVRGSSDTVGQLEAGLHADNANNPGPLIAVASFYADALVLNPGSTPSAGRWFHIPMSVYLTAGDYWLSFVSWDSTGIEIAYDAGGSDKNYASGSTWQADGGRYTINTDTKTYSVRGSVLS